MERASEKEPHRSRFIEENDVGQAEELDCDRKAALLTARETRERHTSDFGVCDALKAGHFDDLLDVPLLVPDEVFAIEPHQRRVSQSLANGEILEKRVRLFHVSLGRHLFAELSEFHRRTVQQERSRVRPDFRPATQEVQERGFACPKKKEKERTVKK